MDDVHVLSFKNPSFGDFKHRIYPKKFAKKDTSGTVRSALYLEFHLEIDGKGKRLTNYRCTWSILPVSSGVRVANLLSFLCTCFFGYIIFFVVCVCV